MIKSAGRCLFSLDKFLHKKGFGSALGALILPIVILGGIMSGVFTATEAAAIAVLVAFILGFFFFKSLR